MDKIETLIKIDGNKEIVTMVIRTNPTEGFATIHVYNKDESFMKKYTVECSIFNGNEDNYCYELTAEDLIGFIKQDFSYND